MPTTLPQFWAELWYLQRPELSGLVGVPGTLVRFQTDSEHQAEDYGLYCLPGIKHQHFVYGVHSQSLCEATSVALAISAHTSDLLRSQVGLSMFHYPSCPPGASSSLGVVVWVRGQLGLVDQEWHRARVQSSRLVTALELELRPGSDRKMLEDLYGPAGVISARVSLRPRSLRLDFPRNAPHRHCNLQPLVLDDLAAPDGPFLTLINDEPPDLVVGPPWPSAVPCSAPRDFQSEVPGIVRHFGSDRLLLCHACAASSGSERRGLASRFAKTSPLVARPVR